jgi:hypothetical protein
MAMLDPSTETELTDAELAVALREMEAAAGRYWALTWVPSGLLLGIALAALDAHWGNTHRSPWALVICGPFGLLAAYCAAAANNLWAIAAISRDAHLYTIAHTAWRAVSPLRYPALPDRLARAKSPARAVLGGTTVCVSLLFALLSSVVALATRSMGVPGGGLFALAMICGALAVNWDSVLWHRYGRPLMPKLVQVDGEELMTRLGFRWTWWAGWRLARGRAEVRTP